MEQQMGVVAKELLERLFLLWRETPLPSCPSVGRKLATSRIESVIRRSLEMNDNLVDTVFGKQLGVHYLSAVLKCHVRIHHRRIARLQLAF